MAIRIETRPTDQPLTGMSHWWGAPDLPADTPYPYVTVGEGTDDEYEEPLTFVCQIRCEDIASLDPDGLLPHKGMLYFFAPFDYFLGELESPLDQYTPPVVLYHPQTEGLVPYDICWEGTTDSIFRPAEAISFSIADKASGDGCLMLGKPYQDEVLQEHQQDVCLLQVDEDDRWGLRFFDCGMYYFFMPAKALRQQQWTQATGELFYY